MATPLGYSDGILRLFTTPSFLCRLLIANCSWQEFLAGVLVPCC